jgi:hypothetical protein
MQIFDDRFQAQSGWEDKEEDVNSYWVILGNENLLEKERGGTRLQSLEKSLWKSLLTCPKAHCMTEMLLYDPYAPKAQDILSN